MNKAKQYPDFIIVGAMKAGSTSLRFHLNQHAKIHLPQKELNFFNNQKNFNKGLSWYMEAITKNAKSTASCFGEKSPAYTLEEFVPERMFNLLPNTKLIWVLRDPVARTYSNYLHELKLGHENLSFGAALKAEEKRSAKNIRYAYKHNSFYAEQIERFLQHYPKEQCFFVLFDELIQPYSKTHILNKLFEFLEVSPKDFSYTNQVRNKTTLPKYPKLSYYSNKLGLTKSYKIDKLLHKVNFRNQSPGYPKLNPAIKVQLKAHFKPHNERLSTLINKDLAAWE